MALTEDVLAWPRITRLAECLCAEITNSGLPDVCFCGVMPGAQIAWDYLNCGDDKVCGMAWVRLINIYPSSNFPNIATGFTPCTTGFAFQAEVGILRCIGVDGEPPSAEENLAATQLQLADMAAMQRAIVCCYGGDLVLGPYTPLGPNGGGVGGSWLVTLPASDL